MRTNEHFSPLTCNSLAEHMMAPVRGPSSRPQRRRRPSSTICKRSGSEAGSSLAKPTTRPRDNLRSSGHRNARAQVAPRQPRLPTPGCLYLYIHLQLQLQLTPIDLLSCRDLQKLTSAAPVIQQCLVRNPLHLPMNLRILSRLDLYLMLHYCTSSRPELASRPQT